MTVMKPANPQGKGNLPVLAELSALRQRLAVVPAKPAQQVANELFTALFVLDAQFAFRPVPGQPYFLYQKHGRHRLSLVSPERCGPVDFGRFIARCQLHDDMTWTLQLHEAVLADSAFMAKIEQRRAVFDAALEGASSMDALLPWHLGGSGFVQRACAFALAHSLGVSLDRNGLRQLRWDEAVAALPPPENQAVNT